MVNCEYTAAASRGWSAFDWAEHCLKQERGINEDDICVSYVWRQWQLGEAYIYTPVHQEGPLHYEEKVGIERTSLLQAG